MSADTYLNLSHAFIFKSSFPLFAQCLYQSPISFVHWSVVSFLVHVKELSNVRFFFIFIRLLKNFWGNKQFRRSRVGQKMDQMRAQNISLFSILTVAFNKNTNSKKEDREPKWFLCFLYTENWETCWIYGETFFFRLKISPWT